jgi:hypothetical protein
MSFLVQIEKVGKWSIGVEIATETAALGMLDYMVKSTPNFRVRVIDPKSEIIALDAMGTVPREALALVRLP